jgi:hypothetical protein
MKLFSFLLSTLAKTTPIINNTPKATLDYLRSTERDALQLSNDVSFKSINFHPTAVSPNNSDLITNEHLSV